MAGVGQLAQEQQNEHPVFITQHWTPLSPATLENSEGRGAEGRGGAESPSVTSCREAPPSTSIGHT